MIVPSEAFSLQKNNMVHGPILGSVILFPLPIPPGNIFRQCCGMVGSIIMSNPVSADAPGEAPGNYIRREVSRNS